MIYGTMSYFKSPSVLETHTKILTDENNDFWGLPERAHGWGKVALRLMAVGARGTVCGVHSNILSTYVYLNFSTRFF